MNRIDKLFTENSSNILSIFFPAGYPQLDDTMPILEQLQARGVDMVEIGIPFSDPMADGVVIQQASTQALKNGISLGKIFEQLADLRPTITMPVILMGYLNPIMQFGFRAFCERCVAVGVDGVIIPDLPFDIYVESYKSIAEQHGIKVIMLITPETSEERIRLIDTHTSGFIYMVSSASTTGVQSSFEQATEYFERISSMKLRNARLVGFGISNRSTFEAACAASNGAIIGSRFVELLTSCDSHAEAVEQLFSSLTKQYEYANREE